MINTVFRLESSFSKSIGFDSGFLYLSALQYESIEGLRDKCNSSTKRSDMKIALSDIQKIALNDQSESITLHYKNKNGRTKNFHLTDFHPNTKEVLCSSLAKAAGITNHELKKNKTVDFSIDYIRIGATIIGTGFVAYFSNEPISGSRSSLLKLAKDIGPVGVSITGGILILFILYKMYKQTKNPANEDVYTR
jgi:hypothetical protein